MPRKNRSTTFRVDPIFFENSLTSNPVLQQLSSRNFDDLYALVDAVENKNADGISLERNHTNQEISEYKAVLEKVLTVRDTVLKVNETYINLLLWKMIIAPSLRLNCKDPIVI